MSARFVILILLAGAVGLCATLAISMVGPSSTEPARATTEPSSSPTSDAARREHIERFLSGDPNRTVRGGQEMKPRW
ncbi:Ti type entry exclusion protein TrbK [Ancylobacter sp. 3268]|uniref:entry exclusion protein TrbK n=1 Tax=Ancylobacter sp. 3268 TaxID=2817752 RepID=UPI0028674F0E|nr:entry exclusion protein TrbK [Ancylobacter sp. 3268]MDR6955672.1 Ti type entry exclusion protein TrbK [Ancylobacter sp. 3268]